MLCQLHAPRQQFASDGVADLIRADRIDKLLWVRTSEDDALLAHSPPFEREVVAVRSPLERPVAADRRVDALLRAEATNGDTVHVGDLVVPMVRVGSGWEPPMQVLQSGELRLGDRTIRDDEQVHIACLWIETAKGQRATEVCANEVVAECLTNAP
jgi:hypothetical protein